MSKLVTFAKRNKKEVKRFIKFMVVGAIGFVVDFGVFNVLVHIMNVPVTVAGIISFGFAVTQNFFWNRFWTYPESKAHPFLSQYIQFVLINATALLIRIPILAFLPTPIKGLFISVFNAPDSTAEFLGNNGAFAIAVAIAMFWNFFINRFVTYRHIKVGQ